jgi:hypothetical protein
VKYTGYYMRAIYMFRVSQRDVFEPKGGASKGSDIRITRIETSFDVSFAPPLDCCSFEMLNMAPALDCCSFEMLNMKFAVSPCFKNH